MLNNFNGAPMDPNGGPNDPRRILASGRIFHDGGGNPAWNDPRPNDMAGGFVSPTVGPNTGGFMNPTGGLRSSQVPPFWQMGYMNPQQQQQLNQQQQVYNPQDFRFASEVQTASEQYK